MLPAVVSALCLCSHLLSGESRDSRFDAPLVAGLLLALSCVDRVCPISPAAQAHSGRRQWLGSSSLCAALLTSCVRSGRVANTPSHFPAKGYISINKFSRAGLIKPLHPLALRKENMYQQGIENKSCPLSFNFLLPFKAFHVRCFCLLLTRQLMRGLIYGAQRQALCQLSWKH